MFPLNQEVRAAQRVGFQAGLDFHKFMDLSIFYVYKSKQEVIVINVDFHQSVESLNAKL